MSNPFECLICQVYDNSLCKLKCNCQALYHRECVFQWFRISESKKCPHCKVTVLENETESTTILMFKYFTISFILFFLLYTSFIIGLQSRMMENLEMPYVLEMKIIAVTIRIAFFTLSEFVLIIKFRDEMYEYYKFHNNLYWSYLALINWIVYINSNSFFVFGDFLCFLFTYKIAWDFIHVKLKALKPIEPFEPEFEMFPFSDEKSNS